MARLSADINVSLSLTKVNFASVYKMTTKAKCLMRVVSGSVQFRDVILSNTRVVQVSLGSS